VTALQPWPWPSTMDALHATPTSHRVLLDNDRVRVLEVVIEPKSPPHSGSLSRAPWLRDKVRTIGDNLRVG
jgi:hypothetical protein